MSRFYCTRSCSIFVVRPVRRPHTLDKEITMRKLFMLGLVVCVTAGCDTTGRGKLPDLRPEELPDLVRGANYVFRATIEEVGESNVTAIPASDRTVVARIDTVFDGAADHGDFTGRSITIIMPADQPARPRGAVDVFGRVLAYGESLVVDAVAVFEPTRTTKQRDDQVKTAIATNRDQTLISRLKSADLVLLGAVATEPTRLADAPELAVSEHDPQWRVVEIRPEQVLRGKAEKVSVVFASSDDIRWFRSPKLDPRARGIFILRMQESKEFPVRGYLLTDPEDFRPAAELDRVRQLLEK